MIILILNNYNKDLYTQITDNNDMDILVKNDLLVNTRGKLKKL